MTTNRIYERLQGLDFDILHQQGSTKWVRSGKTVVDVSILPDFDDKLLLDVVDSGLGAVTLPDPKWHVVAKTVGRSVDLS